MCGQAESFFFFFFPQLKSNIMCSQDILMAFWDLTLLFFILKVSSKGMTLVQYFILSRFVSSLKKKSGGAE